MKQKLARLRLKLISPIESANHALMMSLKPKVLMDKKIKKIQKESKKVDKDLRGLAKADKKRDKTCEYGSKMMKMKK